MKSVTQIWRYVRYYVSFGRLMHTIPHCTSCAVYDALLLQSLSLRGLLWSVSLCSGARWALNYTEQDWNLMKICSRMHVSIITDLMRTMNLLLACIHHTLNPQLEEMMITTMYIAIVFPLQPLWVMWHFTANLLFSMFPTPIAIPYTSSAVSYLMLQSLLHWTFIELLSTTLASSIKFAVPFASTAP